MLKTLHELTGAADDYQRILFLLQGGAVKRYHTVTTIKEDTCSSHSWGVAWLCYILCPGEPSVRLIMAALSHDMGEQVWGDVPSPVKRKLGIRDQLTALEEGTLKLNKAFFPLTEVEAGILAIADCMDGLLFCIREHRLGNRNMEVVYLRYYSYIMALDLNRQQFKILETIDQLWKETYGTASDSASNAARAGR